MTAKKTCLAGLLSVSLSSAVAACDGAPVRPDGADDPLVRPAARLSACALETACTWPLVVAHRGLGGGAPENTVAGVTSAVAAGADAVEVDVRTTADGALVLMHDDNATRTTDVATKFPDRQDIAALTLAELRTLVVDDPACSDENADDNPARCRIGEFDALLAAARDVALVMIDFKAASPEAVAAAVRGADALDTAWFFDASEENLDRAVAEEPGLVVMARASSEASALDLLARRPLQLLHTDPGYQRVAAEAARDVDAKTLINVLATADLGLAAGSDSGFADARALLTQTFDDGVKLVQTNFAGDVRASVDNWMADR